MKVLFQSHDLYLHLKVYMYLYHSRTHFKGIASGSNTHALSTVSIHDVPMVVNPHEYN